MKKILTVYYVSKYLNIIIIINFIELTCYLLFFSKKYYRLYSNATLTNNEKSYFKSCIAFKKILFMPY